MFRDLLTALVGSLLADRAMPAETNSLGTIKTKDTARNVIFLFLGGAPSHVDTFDFKNIDGVTPADLSLEQFGEVTLPTSLVLAHVGSPHKKRQRCSGCYPAVLHCRLSTAVQ